MQVYHKYGSDPCESRMRIFFSVSAAWWKYSIWISHSRSETFFSNSLKLAAKLHVALWENKGTGQIFPTILSESCSYEIGVISCSDKLFWWKYILLKNEMKQV